MTPKQSQLARIKAIFNETGKVSRNYFVDLPYDKITRLSEYIRILRKKQGWDIHTDEVQTETGKDTIYTLISKPQEEKFEIVKKEDGQFLARKIVENKKLI